MWVLNWVWVKDIMYIHTHEGWLYLAILLDLFWRQAIDWSMSSGKLAMNTLVLAVWQRQPKNTVMVHSDQHIEFNSYD